MDKIQPRCENEFGELKTVLVCSPSTLDVSDQKTADYVQWEKPVDHEIALENFQAMKAAMESEGVKAIDYADYLKEDDAALSRQLINRIFVRDLACVFRDRLIPGDAGTSMRAPEYAHSHRLFSEWFEPDIFRIEDNNELKALEYGDLMLLNKDAILVNTGLRTSIESIEAVQGKMFAAGYSEIAIIDLPRRGDTLHLDMNLNAVGEGVILAKGYMRFLPVQVVHEGGSHYYMLGDFLRRHGYDILWTDDVSHTVADINFLNLNPETLLVSTKMNRHILKEHPKRKQLRIIEVDVNELEKGGGGIRCMTLPFIRA
jgi:arginine deiminase